MKRREVISLLGGSALWPLAARGQQAGKIWRIGFLTPRSRPSPAGRDAFSDAFMRGMSDLGYSEGKNLVVAWRYADGDYKRLTGFAIELVGMDLPVIVTYGTAAARVLQGATKTLSLSRLRSIWWAPASWRAWRALGAISPDCRSSTWI